MKNTKSIVGMNQHSQLGEVLDCASRIWRKSKLWLEETGNTGNHHTNNSAWDELSQVKIHHQKSVADQRKQQYLWKGITSSKIRSDRPTTLAGDLDMPGNSNISAEQLPHEQLYWGACLIDEGKTTASSTSLRKKSTNLIFQREHTRGEKITTLLETWSVNKIVPTLC